MVKIESVHIEELRGIRKLDLELDRKTFAICGPNGSGKSGVIDAIEFGLTGQIGRLTGRGTKGLSVADHGAHVDKVKFPDASFVRLGVYLTDLNKSATITRKISSPSKPQISPSDPDIKVALGEIAEHPEIALSRREILRFILVEPSKRSEEIQSLLKLEDVGQTRNALNTANNRLQAALTTTKTQLDSLRASLQRHLQTGSLRAEDILVAVNKRREVLNLAPIVALTRETDVNEGLSATARAAEFNKESALRDLKAFADAYSQLDVLAQAERKRIGQNLAAFDTDPSLMLALRQRSFVEQGIAFLDRPECPLCNSAWDSTEKLRDHLKAKLARSEEAQKLREALLKDGGAVAKQAIRVAGLIGAVAKAAQDMGEGEFSHALRQWKSGLDAFGAGLDTVEKMAAQRSRLAANWIGVPDSLTASLEAFTEKLNAKPDQSSTLDAQTFLATAQLRLNDYRRVMKEHKGAEAARVRSKQAYDIYCTIQERELNTLYQEVEKEFSAFYRALNQSDESKFAAKFTPTASSVMLDVNFYDRGLYPPAAFHSEGHQDGMGVCLYLALMRRLLGKQFTLSLLDDVVMSVDAGHRYEFCQLLKTQFPDVQFVITTHDRLWAEQMKSAKLVTSKALKTFHSWTIDNGPLVESDSEIWNEIADSLGKGKVETAAHALRLHLEYSFRVLADQLGASPQFRIDGDYDLGDMLTAVLDRMKRLWGKAAESAQAWKDEPSEKTAAENKMLLSTCNGAAMVEQWAVNRAVHYNAWANFGKKDFEPVVSAFKELLGCFRCAACGQWLHVSPRVRPESLRCPCNKTNYNLTRPSR